MTWACLGPEIQAALIAAAATVVVAFFGFGGLILQMQSQSRQSREAIAENERRKLKAEMYNDAVEVTRNLVDAAIELSTRLRTTATELNLAAQADSVGLGYQVPRGRYPEFIALYQTFSDAALRFVYLIENRRIVDPRILIFRTAMNAALHDCREQMFFKFSINVAPLLPVENAAGELYPYKAPAPESAKAAGENCEQFCESLMDVISYTEDFLVELQNHLLGDLFARNVAHRKPLDPNSQVITLDRAEELEEWFSKHTAWGRLTEKVESETRRKFSR